MARYATSAMFGFDFQSNVAIVLMIEDMAEIKTVRIESEGDIEPLTHYDLNKYV